MDFWRKNIDFWREKKKSEINWIFGENIVFLERKNGIFWEIKLYLERFSWFLKKKLDFWQIFRFLKKNKWIFGKHLDFWKKSGFLEKFHFSLFTWGDQRRWQIGNPKGDLLTYLPTYLQTWVGARDTCVSKKMKKWNMLEFALLHCHNPAGISSF